MKNDRGGFALIMALWLMVAISVVALQFTVAGKERSTLGLSAAERGWGRGTTLGGLAMTQATLDAALLVANQNPQPAATSAFDPMIGADSLFGGPILLDSTQAEVHIDDLGAKININKATSAQLNAFFAWVVGDVLTSAQLTDAITDFRDSDDVALLNGGEAADYIKAGLLVLPTNAPFRQVEDLQNVMGFTPDLYAQIAPFLTVYGPGTINVNTAPVEVLHSIPGMTDDIISNILSQRMNGQRITSTAGLVPGAAAGGAAGGRGGAAAPGNPLAAVQAAQLAGSTTVTSNQFIVTVKAWPGRQTHPVLLTALLTRAGTTTTLGWKQWR